MNFTPEIFHNAAVRLHDLVNSDGPLSRDNVLREFDHLSQQLEQEIGYFPYGYFNGENHFRVWGSAESQSSYRSLIRSYISDNFDFLNDTFEEFTLECAEARKIVRCKNFSPIAQRIFQIDVFDNEIEHTGKNLLAFEDVNEDGVRQVGEPILGRGKWPSIKLNDGLLYFNGVNGEDVTLSFSVAFEEEGTRGVRVNRLHSQNLITGKKNF